MEMVVGYKLIEVATGKVIQEWGGTWGQCPGVPNPITLPNGDIVYGPVVNTDYSGYMLIPWEMVDPGPVVPTEISRRQCATQLRNDGYITQDEAFAMASAATIPPFVQGYFDTLNPVDKSNAELAFTAIEYPRSSSLLVAVMEANGLTESQIDQFFIAAAQL